MDTSQYAELRDRHGNSVFFGHAGDILLPAFSLLKDFRQHVRDIRSMELQSDDVLLCGFPKTGFHWVYEIVSMLVAGRVEYLRGTGKEGFLDVEPPKERRDLGSEPRLFFTHLKFHHLPKQVWEKGVKVIYLRRNPKDTWVSLYNHTRKLPEKPNLHFGGSWSQFFDLMISFGYWYGDWFDYALDYEREMQTNTDLPFYTCVFEDTKQDPVGQVENLDRFLGLNRGRELCRQIADACNFGSMKDGKVAADQFINVVLRKGDVGDWKNWFTVAQNERFDEVYSRRMAKSKLSYKFEL